ncbi:MAG: alpha/beta fold hydrolase [Nitrospirales bacterium]|nr:alpha/beta fold hydrolase [Nitrospirales bacterium]
MRIETLAGLEVCITGGTDREGGGTGPVVVLLHGFGAPGHDLVSLWRMLDVPDSVRFLFPVAPLRLPQGYGDGRAWWMIDMERLARDQTEGRERDIQIIPNGLLDVRAQVLGLLEEVEALCNIGSDQLVLGGFSQGAMLACDVALHAPSPLAGLVLLSATIIAHDEWTELIPKRKDLPVFQSHGHDDPLLSFQTACQLRDTLKAHGLDVEWHEFQGSHEIPINVLSSLGPFLRRVFGQGPS